MKKKEEKNILYMLLGSIVVIVIIPVIINYLLDKDLITSLETNSSDWLSFWGSFLGGIVGGFATLLGVRYTIKQMEKENENINRPVVIPYKVNYTIDIDETEYKVKNYIPQIDVPILKDYKDESNIRNAFIYLINISLHNALNINVKWIKPQKQEIHSWIQSTNLMTDDIIKKIEKLENVNVNTNIPLIRSAEANGYYEMNLHKEVRKCIYLLLDLFDCNNELPNLPIGTFEITSYDIYGKKYIDRFTSYMTVQCYTTQFHYDVKVEFEKEREE